MVSEYFGSDVDDAGFVGASVVLPSGRVLEGDVDVEAYVAETFRLFEEFYGSDPALWPAVNWWRID